MNQQKRLLAMLGDKLPDGANPILHSDMGWQYQHPWWRKELERLNIRQSMSRKGHTAWTTPPPKQVFGHLKDEFYRGREFDSYEQFKSELDAYIIHWKHQTTPDTTRGTHPGGIPDHVPRSLERYPNKQRPTNGAQFNNGGVAPACGRWVTGRDQSSDSAVCLRTSMVLDAAARRPW